MKVLFLSQGNKIEDHPGWDLALKKLKEECFIDDYLNIPWQGYGEEHGWKAFYEKVLEETKRGGYDIVYFHAFHRKDVPDPGECIQKVQAIKHRPIVITSVGDPFSCDWMMPDYPRNFKIASRFADITFSTQMGKAADKMTAWGAKNIVFSPLGICPVRFKSYAINPNEHKFDFDVVFVGSRNGGRFNPFSKHFWAAKKRERLVHALDSHFGKRLGLFGRGWDNLKSNQGMVPFDNQQETFRRGRVFVGGTPYATTDYYMSNRPFLSVAAGVPTIEIKTPRMDKILRAGDQIYFADDVSGVIAKVEELLQKDPAELYEKAARAAKEMIEKHTQYHRMKFKLDTVKRFVANGGKLDVEFPFFLPEVDLKEEMKYATEVCACGM